MSRTRSRYSVPDQDATNMDCKHGLSSNVLALITSGCGLLSQVPDQDWAELEKVSANTLETNNNGSDSRDVRARSSLSFVSQMAHPC